MPDPTTIQWALIAAAVLVGGLLTGASGFGFALATTPVLVWVLEPVTVIVVNLCLSVLLRLPIIATEVRHINRYAVAPLLIGGALGLPVGVAILDLLSSESAELLLSVMVIIAGLSYLISPRWIGPVRCGRAVHATLVGMASGALTTSSSLSGPPIVLWLTNQRFDKWSFRVTLSLTGLVLNVIGLLMLYFSGRVEPTLFTLPLLLLPVSAVGAFIGHRVLIRLSDQGLARAAACVVVASGAIGIAAWLR